MNAKLVQASQEALLVKNLPANAGDVRDTGSITESGRSSGRGKIHPSFLPGEVHRQRSLEGCNLCSCKESHMTECAHKHTH